MIPVAIYVLGALCFFLLRNVQAAVRLAWLTGLVDVGAVGAILFGVQQASPSPPAVATFALGLFALIVASSALVLRPAFVFVTAAAASLAEIWLLRSTDLPWGVIAIAIVVLFAVAAMTQVSARRLQAVASGLARAEVARQLEHLRGEALVREKQTIETKLTDSQAQNELLIQLQAAKESLAQVLVHDLRNPVSSVMAALDLIRQELEDAGIRPDLQRSAQGALRQADRLTAMIADLLDVARLEEGKLQPHVETLSAAGIVEDVKAQTLLLPRAKKLAIEAEAVPDLRVDADPKLLTRMVENLAANAVRFASGRVRISVAREESQLVFRVQNDGPPLNPTIRAHLFEKFAQAGRTDGGWGLGLYFCRLAAEVHGGSVAVMEDPAWNVTFALRLPAHVDGKSLAA
jgi:signal transduction histidine kinase